ncbi:hypothetical protein EDB89DRAFT_1910904 [Lactarius sanguifluus]|nr:hypothetical protein EDB89DRAFT_1910904 [Lactarius sanguifluus]
MSGTQCWGSVAVWWRCGLASTSGVVVMAGRRSGGSTWRWVGVAVSWRGGRHSGGSAWWWVGVAVGGSGGGVRAMSGWPWKHNDGQKMGDDSCSGVLRSALEQHGGGLAVKVLYAVGVGLMGEGIERVSLVWLDEGWKWEEMGGVKQEPGWRDLLKENCVKRRLNLWRGKVIAALCRPPSPLVPVPTCCPTWLANPCHVTPTPCTRPRNHQPTPTRHARPHRQPAATPSQHGMQRPATTDPHATANAPPCCPNMACKTTPHADSHHTAPTQMQGPVTADPPCRPNTAHKTPPSPTCLHATPTWMQGPVTADPPCRPNTARKTHRHAAPTWHARPVVTPPRHGYKAPSPPTHHATPTRRARPHHRQPVITLPRHGHKTHH